MATSKPEIFARRIADHFGISESLDLIVGSTLDGSLIEKADIIAKAMRDGGFGAEASVMIGDTVFDIEGARKNGMSAVAVTYGYGENEALSNSEADAVLDTVSELSEYLLS
jgi:phosphoglycolate phosphatase